jgi:hypothetical protein
MDFKRLILQALGGAVALYMLACTAFVTYAFFDVTSQARAMISAYGELREMRREN